MVYPLIIVGGFLVVAGTVIFVIDCFKVHILWGLFNLILPIVGLVCLVKHWSQTKRGFLLSLAGYPFLIGALFLMPKAEAKVVNGKPESRDPFKSLMQKAHDAVSKVKESRQETTENVPTPVADVAAPSVPAQPVATVTERLAQNRAAFRKLETDFAALDTKRKALPKKGGQAVAAFNLEAKDYAARLAATRAEQAVLLELQKSVKK